jgi:N utilization substance protein B
MVSRRILRIKIIQLLYAYYKSSASSLRNAEKELFFSIQKTYDLYHYLLLLIIDVADYALTRIEIAREKKIPTWEDLHPNTKFVDNKIIAQLRINRQLNEYLKNKKLSWINYPEIVRNLFNNIKESEYYKEYMSNSERSYEEDKKLLTNIFVRDVAVFENLYQNLEEQSIYWNDEVEFVISIIIKTIRKFRESDGDLAKILPLFKNEEDIEFVKRLFRKAILKSDEYRKLIEEFAKNWEIERIAFIDILIMQTAIAEAVEFPSIPTKVTFNEYLEIAKYYSTSKSSVFINGLLDKIITHLKEKNIVKKSGRGLIGENLQE